VDIVVDFEFRSGGLVAVKIVESEAGLGLAFDDVKRGKPYYVDFTSMTWRNRLAKGLPRNHIFRRALGVQDKPLRVLDATAGFGQDTMTAFSLGCEVVAVERSHEVARVLRDGIERAIREHVLLRDQFKRLKIVDADARQYLLALKPEDYPDVVYLDPMFNKPKKKAKSSKEMQLLQELIGVTKDGEEEELFDAAFKVARSRVVVKRPLKARALKRTPTHSFKGQSIRYDVYTK
jgi:16S rRNA (guanine1516-N2)-methyltransferase